MASIPCCNQGLLWRALLASLLLHAVLLLQPGSGDATSSRAPARMQAMLLEETPPPVAVQPATPTKPVRAAAPGAIAAPLQAAATDTAPPPAPAAGDAAPAQPMDEAGEAWFVEERKSYLFLLAAEARRAKRYPPRALAAGRSGMAEIQVTIEVGGEALAPRLRQSSGHADIDAAALAMVATAVQRTPVPASLHGRGLDVVLPVSFTITEP